MEYYAQVKEFEINYFNKYLFRNLSLELFL